MKSFLAFLLGYAQGVLARFGEAGPQDTVPPGYASAIDMLALQYHVVRHSAALRTNIASDATNSGVLGVIQNNPRSLEAATITFMGASKVVAGGVVAAGDIISYNSSGRAATVTSGQMAIGRALEAAGANGEKITALLFPPVRWAGAA